MTAKQWKTKIIKAAKEAGTYRPFFNAPIETLAAILEKRDNAEELFQQSGGNVLVKHTNKGGATNIEQNPLIRLINDLNRDALAYWRDLGLTPSGLRKINEQAMTVKKRSALAEALRDLGG